MKIATTLIVTCFAGVTLASTSFAGSREKNSVVVEEKHWAPGDPMVFGGGLFTVDVEERLRYEFRDNNFDFNSGASSVTDGSFLLQRARIGLKFQPISWLTFYAQAQSSIEVSRRPGPPGAAAAEGDDYIDLYQGFVEIGDLREFPLSAKIGRQAMNYGEQRLIGSFDWNNLGRTFDAARLRFENESVRVDLFASSVVLVRHDTVNFSDVFNWSDTGREMVFSGIYATSKTVPAHTIDMYALWLSQARGNNTNFAPLLGLPPAGSQGGNRNAPTNFGTFGFRIQADPKQLSGFEYDIEAAAQFGQVAGLDLAAFALHSGIGYTADLPWEPRLYLQYNFASGDNNPGDGRTTTFQNLFPTNHKFYGYMDLFSWQNLHNTSATFTIKPFRQLTLGADLHFFWLATTNDAWYRANGLSRARPITPSADPFVGTELDLTFTWKPVNYLALHGGYSLFLPGGYVRDTGAADVANFVYLQAQFNF